MKFIDVPKEAFFFFFPLSSLSYGQALGGYITQSTYCMTQSILFVPQLSLGKKIFGIRLWLPQIDSRLALPGRMQVSLRLDIKEMDPYLHLGFISCGLGLQSLVLSQPLQRAA